MFVVLWGSILQFYNNSPTVLVIFMLQYELVTLLYKSKVEPRTYVRRLRYTGVQMAYSVCALIFDQHHLHNMSIQK